MAAAKCELRAGHPQKVIAELAVPLTARGGAEGLQLLAEARFLTADYRGTLADLSTLRANTPGGHIDQEAALLGRIAADPSGENWTGIRANLNLATGFTDNAAASPGLNEFAGFILNERADESPSAILEADARAGFAADARAARIDGSSAAGCRHYPDAEFADECRLALAMNVTRQSGQLGGSLGITLSQHWLDASKYYHFAGLESLLRRHIGTKWSVTGELSAGLLDYDATRLGVLDVYRVFAALTLTRRGFLGANTDAAISILGVGDEPLQSRSTFGNQRLGVRAVFEHHHRENVLLFAEIGFMHADFDGEFGFFLRDRMERLYQASAGLRWVPVRRWTADATLQYTERDSTVDVFSFRRFEVLLNVSRALN